MISPREQVQALAIEKDAIEAEIQSQISILKSNKSTMQTPLVDSEGFPRADIDIYAVRGARVRIIELRNDLGAITAKIGKVLESVYDPALQPPPSATLDAPKPFAKVNAVASGGPAAEAGLQQEDLIIKFGGLTHESIDTSLKAVAELVGANENKSITVKVSRGGKVVFLALVPKKWDGRGMLGCHIIPHSSQ